MPGSVGFTLMKYKVLHRSLQLNKKYDKYQQGSICLIITIDNISHRNLMIACERSKTHATHSRYVSSHEHMRVSVVKRAAFALAGCESVRCLWVGSSERIVIYFLGF